MLLRQLAGIRWAVSFSFIFLSSSLLPKRCSSNSASLSETGGPQSSSLSKEAAMSWKISSPPSLSPCLCTMWSGEGFSVSTSIAVLHDGLGRLLLSSWGSAFIFPPIAPRLTFSLYSKQSIRFANFWTVSKIVASVSQEGLGIGDASMLFTSGTISSVSAGGWLFLSLLVTECLQVRVVLSRRHPTCSSPTHYGLTCWLKRRSTSWKVVAVLHWNWTQSHGTAQCGRCWRFGS